MTSNQDDDKMPLNGFSPDSFPPEMLQAIADEIFEEIQTDILDESLFPDSIHLTPLDIAAMQAFEDAIQRGVYKRPQSIPEMSPLAKAIFEKLPRPGEPR